MDIKAFKMDGLGNDFVIIDQRNNNINFSKDQIINFLLNLDLKSDYFITFYFITIFFYFLSNFLFKLPSPSAV